MAAVDGRQEDVRIPVSLYSWTSKKYEIAGTLTLPPEGVRKPVVQVLIHGLTYARYYNDFPYKPDQYSYVNHVTDAGYPTLNIDRLGSGDSSHPIPELITLNRNAWCIDQIIRALKNGEIGKDGISFPEVMLVGHSYGSYVSIQTQRRYSNANYLILTGFSQTQAQGKPSLTPLLSTLHPAFLDDDKDINHLSPGYITTKPGDRGIFYYKPGAELRVIEIDERMKQTGTVSEVASIPEEYKASEQVNIPVLEINGNQDSLFCGDQECSSSTGVSATEPSFWPEAEFTFKTIPEVSHDLYLHRRAPEVFQEIVDWSDEHVSGGS